MMRSLLDIGELHQRIYRTRFIKSLLHGTTWLLFIVSGIFLAHLVLSPPAGAPASPVSLFSPGSGAGGALHPQYYPGLLQSTHQFGAFAGFFLAGLSFLALTLLARARIQNYQLMLEMQVSAGSGMREAMISTVQVSHPRSRRQRALDAQANSDGGKSRAIAATGDLERSPVRELLVRLSVAEATGCLAINGRNHRGTLYLHSGLVIAARCGNLSDREAIDTLFRTGSGRYEFYPDVFPEQRNLLLTLADLGLHAGTVVRHGKP